MYIYIYTLAASFIYLVGLPILEFAWYRFHKLAGMTAGSPVTRITMVESIVKV